MCSVLSVYFYLALYRYSRSQGHIIRSLRSEPDTPMLSKSLISHSYCAFTGEFGCAVRSERSVKVQRDLFSALLWTSWLYLLGLLVGKKASCQLIFFCISFGEHVCVGRRSCSPKDFWSNPVGKNIHLSTAKQHWRIETNKIQNCIIEKYQQENFFDI